MNSAVLRASGSEQALIGLRNSLDLIVDAEWKKGEARRFEGTFEQSGFNSHLGDAATPVDLVALIREFLIECRDKNASFVSPELKAELDLGISVGDTAQFAPNVGFTPTDMQLFAELGLSLRVSSYPVMDEDE